MRLKKLTLAAISAIFMIGAAACNYPGVGAPTPFEFPTPNATMTAVFNPTSQVPGTGTSLPQPATATSAPTQQPSATQPLVFPTATSAPPTAVPPTDTPVSFEGPDVRQGTSLEAAFLDQKPVIDGDFSDWDLDKYTVNKVVYGASNWKGETDLSAKVMFGWDENNLYIAARVMDDRYAQEASGEDIFLGDSLEILLDTNVSADYYQKALSRDDFQVGISPGSPDPGEDPEAYLWYPQADAGSLSKVKIGAVLVDDGYRIEVAVPWDTFDVTAKKGEHFGFAFSVSDNDDPNKDVQQSMVSTSPARVLTAPTTWGDLVLTQTTAQSLKRSGPSVDAAFVSTAPTLDGNLSEWSANDYAVKSVVYGSDKWDSAKDLAGTLMAAWDDNNLYLGVQAVDNRYIQNQTGENIFLGDSLEVLFDSNVGGDFNQKSLSADDYQLGITAGTEDSGANPQAYLWYPQAKAGDRSQVKIASKHTADGYIVEAAIPWSMFGVSPAKGQHYGFVFSISDNDNVSRDVQQTLVSNVSTRVLTNPTTWGDLTLTR